MGYAQKKKPKILVPKRLSAFFLSIRKTSKQTHLDWLGRISLFQEIGWVDKIKTLIQSYPYLCSFCLSSQIPFQLTNGQDGKTNIPMNLHKWWPPTFYNQKINYFTTRSCFIFNLFTNLHHVLSYPAIFSFTNSAAIPHGTLQNDGSHTNRLAAEIFTRIPDIKKVYFYKLLPAKKRKKKEQVSNLWGLKVFM